MQRIHFAVNILVVSAQKLRACSLKEECYRKMYTFQGKMNELLQPRDFYFTLVLFRVKEITHKSHKNYFFQEEKLKIWIQNIISETGFVRKSLKYTHTSHMIIITFYGLENSKNPNMN